MPLECALTYSNGITGSNTKAGRDGTSVVIEFNHEVKSPIDPQMGTRSGARVHGPVIIVKEIDNASASLYQAACTGQTLDELRIDWYRITPAGKEEKYFSHTLSHVKVAAVENILPNTKDPSLEKQTHLERLQLLYQKILWKHEEGFEYEDSWGAAR